MTKRSQANGALWTYVCLVLFFTAGSWILYLHFGSPDIRPFFDASDQFRDLTNYIDKTEHLLFTQLS
jgi:hypothetical protein